MSKKKVVVIDGQGGMIGKELCDRLTSLTLDIDVIAIGTNSVATSNMLKSKVKQGATGENPVVVCSKLADVITGPIGIIVADAMLGEITPKMAEAISQSDATKVLIPMNRCSTMIAGVADMPIAALVDDAISKIISALAN